MGRKQTRRPVPELQVIHAAGGILSLADAATFIADRLREPGCSVDYETRERVRTAIRDRIASGALKEVRPGFLMLAAVADMARALTARALWPAGRYDDLPSEMRGHVTLPALTISATSHSTPRPLPRTLRECHAELRHKDEVIVQLSSEVERLTNLVASLAPDAKQWREMHVRNENSAREKRNK